MHLTPSVLPHPKERGWGRDNSVLLRTSDFHEYIPSTSPIRDFRLGEGGRGSESPPQGKPVLPKELEEILGGMKTR
jgi:hypothetical protein